MLIALVILVGLMAGTYFSFSVFMMRSLAQLPVLEGARAMNKINDVIVNTTFLPIFFGSTLWMAGLVVWQFADWNDNASSLIIASALIYIVGMFGVTAFGNVPLNNALKRSENNEHALAQCWSVYQQKWNKLNHIRTASCIVACGLLSTSLSLSAI